MVGLQSSSEDTIVINTNNVCKQIKEYRVRLNLVIVTAVIVLPAL